jgi:hypothetical protein
VPDRHDISFADEQMRLAEGDASPSSCAVRATMNSASPYCSIFGR